MTPELDISPTIAEAAGRCLGRFQKCLEQSASISSQEMALVEDQLGRFSLWTASIGVFVGGRASLDHRLREAQEVHEVIIGLLETLDDQVESWSHFLESMLRPQVLETGPRPEPESIAPSRRAVSNQIALLHRLSNTIRRASTVAQNEKISTLFTIRDEEKNDVEPCLELVFTNYIRDKFRSVDNNLLRRLVSAMILRRKRILYKRARFGHKALKVLPTKTRPELTALPMNSQQKAAVISPEIPSASPPVADDLPVRSQAGFTATTLAPEDFKKHQHLLHSLLLRL
ncbi:hypothetical protein N7454_010910 [Penicillium verhagenii]|nr:hypothetical protein N7454_010910 [Penicillium verhagenii]